MGPHWCIPEDANMPNGSHDTICNSSPKRTLQDIVDARLSRRGFLGGGLATAATVSVGGVGVLLDAVPVSAKSNRRDPLLGFQGIPVSSEDTVKVPHGYTAKVLIAWGDPLSDGPAFKQDASNSAAEQALQWGMHNDGVVYFPLDWPDGFWDQRSDKASDHGLYPDLIPNGTNPASDKFGSPDGIYVAPSGRLWIQTDVSASTINLGAVRGLRQQSDALRRPDDRRGRRFLVGPNACEITGVFTTPDETTMFVGIRHPGEPPSGNHTPNDAEPTGISSWPDGDDAGRPRSSCIVITKDDGGPIGS